LVSPQLTFILYQSTPLFRFSLKKGMQNYTLFYFNQIFTVKSGIIFSKHVFNLPRHFFAAQVH